MGRRLFKITIGIFASAASCAVILLGAAVALRPDIDSGVDLYSFNRPPAYHFTDAKGAVIGNYGPAVGQRLKLSDMPAFLPAAFLAMEDRNFYSHFGVDPRGVARASLANFRSGTLTQGGSTITQQLVKILFLTPERSLDRKLRELGGAWELERKLSKDEILELYLNRIYLGSGAYGVDGAARVYFGKSAKDVTLAEAALLAAVTRAPSNFSPRRDPELASDRARMVLDAMVQTAAITAAEAEAAKKNPINIASGKTPLDRFYFFDAVAEEVRRLVPGADGDLVVRTTFDARLHAMARGTVEAVLAAKRTRQLKATQASLVAMDPNGAVRALIGGRDYAASQFNRATQAKRQPGSAFKPFVYLAAMERGMTPDSIRGGVTLSHALSRSVNSVALNLQQSVGTRRVTRAAERLGITSQLRAVPSLALGTSEVTNLELTGAYAAFASGGWKTTPYFVEEARKLSGEIVYRHANTPSHVIDSEILLDMNAMMFEVIETGTAERARLADHEAAGKTGTSNAYRDAWFVGYTPQLVTGVWVGNDDFSPMTRVTGGTVPAQIWKRFMTSALKNEKYVPLPRSIPAPVLEPEPPPLAYDFLRDRYYSPYGPTSEEDLRAAIARQSQASEYRGTFNNARADRRGRNDPYYDPYYNPYYNRRMGN